MSETDKQGIERKLPFLSGKVSLLSLQAFDTEQQFSYQIRFNIFNKSAIVLCGAYVIICRFKRELLHVCLGQIQFSRCLCNRYKL